ncbi:leukocyte immunoglobulin-like receptor subfamily A member 6 isoform X6 [Gallus gallus]|uniref:leukocyte immunoglobulin-like receptor subfamily A member 6 isoform X6 n=1 Tax=Gallus gallus TaxID=9031 RepID=UPI001F0040D8|nr:leukocyte immunoglobulin-like receptor subfamily A member 6 isoform X6 [Gallus gallus]XP_046790051.1 leukocyte immunoglobulin-like receptor subfamily A member 6 isoform X6 [Gallus gallus]XP_046790052.1 leukocyte immunoglobulin-like receptor subfamily A member 6 isoform X6 [Gallus gallus]
MAEFSLAGIKQADAVRYQCQYQGLEPAGTSEKSHPVELLVTDHSYPPPGISLSPREYVKMETNITIQCWNQQYGGTIFLQKDGHSAPIQHQEPDGGGTATFTLFGVTPADSGTYRCSYRIGGSYLLSSPLGDNVTLEVIPRPAPPGATSRSPEVVQFQVSPGDSEGLTYAQLQAVTPSTHPPASSTTPEPPIIYAERLRASMTKKTPRAKMRTAAQPLTTATTRFPRDTNSAPVGYRYLGVFIPSITSMGKECDDTATHGRHWGQTHGGQVPTWGCRCGCHLQRHAVPKG